MNVKRVCVIGGGGFIGRHMAERLAALGVRVIIPTRHRERAKGNLIVLPSVELLVTDVNDPAQLVDRMRGCDAVIHLAGILHERRAGDFRRVHVELTRRVLEACREAGVRRYLHMSALGASATAPSEYLRTKAAAEALVLEAGAAGLATTIFRPSVVFGDGDAFLTLFARMQAVAPFVPLGSPSARLQPVWVEDVAHAFVVSLEDERTVGECYELAGPRVYTLRELVELAGQLSGHPRPVIGLSDGLSRLQARLFGLLPVKLLTYDNYLSLTVDNVSAQPFPEVFGRSPSPLEPVARRYLGGSTPRARYGDYRHRAGR